MTKKHDRQRRPSKSTDMKSRLFGSEFYGHRGRVGKKGGDIVPARGGTSVPEESGKGGEDTSKQ